MKGRDTASATAANSALKTSTRVLVTLGSTAAATRRGWTSTSQLLSRTMRPR